MPLNFLRETFIIPVAATGTVFTITVPDTTVRVRAMQMTLITPDYATGSPTTTISFMTSSGIVYFTDSARAEASTFQVALGNIVMHPGDIIRATLSGEAGAATSITLILHVEE